LGTAIAHRFAQKGFAVALMARDKAKLTQIQSIIEKSGTKVLSVSVDATEPASVQAAFEQVQSQLDAPEVFVYNAGAFQMAGILELTPEQSEQNWKINCFGAFQRIAAGTSSYD